MTLKRLFTFILAIVVFSSFSCAYAATREVKIVGTTRVLPAYLYSGAGENTGIVFDFANTNNTSVALRFHASNPWWPYARARDANGNYVYGRIPIYQVVYTPNLMIASMFTSEVLVSGDRGSAIECLQMMLERVDCDPQGTDGIWGANTTSAVIKFQERANIRQDGKVGPETKLRLLQAAGYIPPSWNYSS